jgi:hypothetical protein
MLLILQWLPQNPHDSHLSHVHPGPAQGSKGSDFRIPISFQHQWVEERSMEPLLVVGVVIACFVAYNVGGATTGPAFGRQSVPA